MYLPARLITGTASDLSCLVFFDVGLPRGSGFRSQAYCYGLKCLSRARPSEDTLLFLHTDISTYACIVYPLEIDSISESHLQNLWWNIQTHYSVELCSVMFFHEKYQYIGHFALYYFTTYFKTDLKYDPAPTGGFVAPTSHHGPS